MNIRLIALDLDGTLLENDHFTISDYNKKMLAEAKKQGIVIAISSGRTVALMEHVVHQLPFIDYLITSNGASAVSMPDRETMFLDGIPYEQWNRIYRNLDEANAYVQIFCNQKCYMKQSGIDNYRESDEMEKEFVEGLKKMMTPVKDVICELRSQPIEKINVMDVPEEKAADLKEQIMAESGLVISSSIERSMELNRQGVNKGVGLQKLCESLGIMAEEVMAFGDSDNDLEMLDWAAYSYAMKNGLEEAKEAAHFVTKYKNTEDGVGRTVEEYLQKKQELKLRFFQS